MSFNAKIANHDGSKKRFFKCLAETFTEFKATGCEKLGLCPEGIHIVMDDDFEVDDFDTVREISPSMVLHFLQPGEKLNTVNASPGAISDVDQDKVTPSSTTVNEMTSVFASGLPTGATYADLVTFFSQYGYVANLKLFHSQWSGVEGSGIVNFGDSESCKRCLADKNPSFLNKTISVKPNRNMNVTTPSGMRCGRPPCGETSRSTEQHPTSHNTSSSWGVSGYKLHDNATPKPNLVRENPVNEENVSNFLVDTLNGFPMHESEAIKEEALDGDLSNFLVTSSVTSVGGGDKRVETLTLSTMTQSEPIKVETVVEDDDSSAANFIGRKRRVDIPIEFHVDGQTPAKKIKQFSSKNTSGEDEGSTQRSVFEMLGRESSNVSTLSQFNNTRKDAVDMGGQSTSVTFFKVQNYNRTSQKVVKINSGGITVANVLSAANEKGFPGNMLVTDEDGFEIEDDEYLQIVDKYGAVVRVTSRPVLQGDAYNLPPLMIQSTPPLQVTQAVPIQSTPTLNVTQAVSKLNTPEGHVRKTISKAPLPPIQFDVLRSYFNPVLDDYLNGTSTNEFFRKEIVISLTAYCEETMPEDNNAVVRRQFFARLKSTLVLLYPHCQSNWDRMLTRICDTLRQRRHQRRQSEKPKRAEFVRQEITSTQPRLSHDALEAERPAPTATRKIFPDPTFTSWVSESLSNRELADANWSLIIAECTQHYAPFEPVNKTDFQTIGRRMTQLYPNLIRPGFRPWSFFNRCLSLNIRKIRGESEDINRKSNLPPSLTDTNSSSL